MRPIDHLVLAVPDLAAAAARYRALGFTVGGRNRHPWGTENHVVQLASGTFLELIGLAADYVPLPAEAPAAPFAAAIATAIEEGRGLPVLALRSVDARADAARLARLSLGTSRLLHFGRTTEGAGGTRRAVAFTLAFAQAADLREAGFFLCQHLQPENFWNPDVQRHANGVVAIDAVTLASPDPARDAGTASKICDADVGGAAGRPIVDTGTGRIEIVEAAADHGGTRAARFAAVRLVVDDLGAAGAALDRSGTPYRREGGALAVEGGASVRVGLTFAARPTRR